MCRGIEEGTSAGWASDSKTKKKTEMGGGGAGPWREWGCGEDGQLGLDNSPVTPQVCALPTAQSCLAVCSDW